MDNFDLRKYLAEGRLFKESRVDLNEEDLNEVDLGTIVNIGLGVAGGLAGLYYAVKGAGFVKNMLGGAAADLAMKMEKKARKAAKSQYKDEIKSIIQKFENDSQLASMYEQLPEEGKERNKHLSSIAKYIKTKLTAEEMEYFTDISAMLRTGDIANNPNISRRPDGKIM